MMADALLSGACMCTFVGRSPCARRERGRHHRQEADHAKSKEIFSPALGIQTCSTWLFGLADSGDMSVDKL